MKQISICIGIFIALSLSRFIPHPPNFTSLLALSFYVPVIFGLRYLPALLISFAITDFIIGYHSGTFFTWGSVFLIGLIANFFAKKYYYKINWSIGRRVNIFCYIKFWSMGIRHVWVNNNRSINLLYSSLTIFCVQYYFYNNFFL